MAEDAKVSKAFASILLKVMSQQSRDRVVRRYSDPATYGEQRLLLATDYTPAMKSFAFTLFTFASLRKGPPMITRYLARKAAQRRSDRGDLRGYQFDDVKTGTGDGRGKGGYQFDAVGSGGPFASQQGGSPRASFVLGALRFGLDAFVSLTLGAYATVAFIDKDKFLSGASSVPLVEGRSPVSEEFCGDVIAFHKQIPSEFWKRERKTDMPFRAIENFAMNCQRRAAYERTLRAQMGMQKSEAVSIPSPGVPKNLEVAVTTTGRMGTWGDGGASAGDNVEDYFGAAASEGSGKEEGNSGTLSEWNSTDYIEKRSDGKDSGWSSR